MIRSFQVGLALAVATAVLGAVWLRHRPGLVRASHEAPLHREIKDATGRTVSIPAQPRRVLSLSTSATDTLIRLGAGAALVAIDEYSRVVPGTSNLAVIGKGSALSREQVLALGIDFALVWWFQEDAARLLADLSVPVVRIRSGRAREVPAMIRLVGQCVNRVEAADQLAQVLAAQLQDLSTAPAASLPRVYLELYGAYKTVGRDSFINDLIELGGGRNIAADTTGSVLLSAERLMQADPDVILFVSEFTNTHAIAQRGGLNQLTAVRQGRVRPVDRAWLVAGAGLPDAVAKLHALIIETQLTEK